MSYFDQFQYSQSLETSYSSQTSENVEKGHKKRTEVDLTRFEEICKKFRDNKDMKIKNLTGTDREDFNLAVSYVNLLYGTDYYTNLFEKVRRNFEKVTSAQAGTVGAYFAGCLISNKNSTGDVPASCNLPCVDGMPLPKQEGWELCDKGVIVAERSGDGYNFSLIKPSHEEGDAYLFVESRSESDFTGFTQEEKDQILAYGCNKVHVVSYTSDLTYSEVSTESVEKLKTRPSHRKRVHRHKKDTKYQWWWVVLIFLVLLFILLAASRWYR